MFYFLHCVDLSLSLALESEGTWSSLLIFNQYTHTFIVLIKQVKKMFTTFQVVLDRIDQILIIFSASVSI